MPRAEKKIPLIECFGPTIQGEGSICGHQTMFLRFGTCDYACKMCIAEDQRVLMADFSVKPIKEVVIGDYVLGMTNSRRKIHKKLIPTRVSDVINQGYKEVIRVTTEVGGRDKKGPFKGLYPTNLVCTKDHRLLNTKWRTYWQQAGNCQDAVLRAVSIFDRPKELTRDYWQGWLHGVILGDGNIHKFKQKTWRMKCSTGDSEIADQGLSVMEALGYKVHAIMHNPGNGKTPLPGFECTVNNDVRKLKKEIDIGIDSDEYRQGWLAGFFDTDGHFDVHSGSIRIGQSIPYNQWKLDKYTEYATSLGFRLNWQENTSVGITDKPCKIRIGIISNFMEFFTLCRPFLQRKYPTEFAIDKMPRAPVSTIEYLKGEVPVYDITTETGNFICEGIVVHNCDSKHAVDALEVKKNATYLTQIEIADQMIALNKVYKCPWVTLSGGNPALWNLGSLVFQLQLADMKIAIETQGTFFPSWIHECDLVTVSPKGPGMTDDITNWDLLEAYVDELLMPRYEGEKDGKGCIKIVIFDEEDMEYAKEVWELCPEHPLHLSLGNPWLPGDDISSTDHIIGLLRRYRDIAEKLYKDPILNKAIFLPQLHALVYSNDLGR